MPGNKYFWNGINVFVLEYIFLLKNNKICIVLLNNRKQSRTFTERNCVYIYTEKENVNITPFNFCPVLTEEIGFY